MKKYILVLISLLLAFSLFGCNSDNEKTDEIAVPFVKALLLKDYSAMEAYIHPDYKETALPNEEFYNNLSKNHFFTAGNELDALEAVDKNYINDTSFEGTLMKCDYLIRSNELLYDVELMILENESGYGIVAVSMKLNTDINYFENAGK